MKRFLQILSVSLILSLHISAQTWSPVGGGTNGSIGALCVYDGTLFVGGGFDFAGGIPVNGAAEWNGTDWYPAGDPGNNIQCFQVYNNELYEGGSMGFSVWDGTNWATVGSGGPYLHVYAMEVFNNRLYTSGTIGIYQWDGSVWSLIGTPNSEAVALCSYKGELYAGGYFTSIDNVAANGIAKWDGSSWSAVGQGVLGGNVYAMDLYDNELYVGGVFTVTAGNTGDNLMRWNGTSWLPVAGGASDEVTEIDSVQGRLYIGGHFSSVGHIAANGIAYFDGSSWHPMSSGITPGSMVSGITEFQGSVIAAGSFTMAGGNICLNIAKWNLDSGMKEVPGLSPLSISPNPVMTSCLIRSAVELRNARFILFNPLGRKVLALENISGKEFKLSREQLPGGIYFMQLIQDNQTIRTAKLLISG